MWVIEKLAASGEKIYLVDRKKTQDKWWTKEPLLVQLFPTPAAAQARVDRLAWGDIYVVAFEDAMFGHVPDREITDLLDRILLLQRNRNKKPKTSEFETAHENFKQFWPSFGGMAFDPACGKDFVGFKTVCFGETSPEAIMPIDPEQEKSRAHRIKGKTAHTMVIDDPVSIDKTITEVTFKKMHLQTWEPEMDERTKSIVKDATEKVRKSLEEKMSQAVRDALCKNLTRR